MKSVSESVLFLLLFHPLFQLARSDLDDISEKFGRKHVGSRKDTDDTMFREIEEEMLLLNKSDYINREKRALGILLQGFMEALGYTVSPIQLASLPNPMPAGGMPAGGMQATLFQQQGMMPTPVMMNASTASPARQRETIRFTGLLNFGNSDNSSHLVNHLSRYEQIFHGNRTPTPTSAAMPAQAPIPASGLDIDPRSRPPLTEPLFVQIPLPIVPNLPPPQPPSPMPLDHSYDGGSSYSKDSSEEYSGSKDDEGQTGHFDEEDEDSHDRDDFEYKYDKYDNPEDRNYENKETGESYEEPKPTDKETEYNDSDERPKPKEKHIEKEYNDSDEQPRSKEKHVEKEYKTNKKVENFSVENKEIHDPREVDVEGPPSNSQFNHATFVDEPDWKEKQDAEVYRIASEQEAHAEALAEENAQREKERERDHNEKEVFHRNREKEINDANEERDTSYQKTPYYDDDEEDGSSEKEHYHEDSKYHESEEKEANHEEKGTQRTEARAQLPNNVDQPNNNNQDAVFYPANLPISYDRDKPLKDQTLRDSYGKSLENPGEKVDERVAEYITMFKNPKTGVYDPNRVHDYEHARFSFDHSDLIDGFNRIQKEYGAPENKYEEYEIDDGDRVEHKSNNKHEDESKESVVTHEPTECSCHKKKNVQLEMQGALSSERSVTRPPPVISSTQPEPSYGPYYSTMKYLYDPLERDHGIIARLTSYEKPTTVRFENRVDVVANRTTVSPTIPPERITTLSFLHEAENKEIRARPARFDYLYDNSEHKSVINKKSPPTFSMPAPFKPTKPSCNHHMMPFGVRKNQIKLPIGDGSGEERFKSDRNLKKSNSFHENRKAKPSEQINKRVEYYTTHRATQPTVYDHTKRPTSTERFSNDRASTKPPTHAPTLADIITARPERAHSTKNPRKNRKIRKHFDQTVRPMTANIGEPTILPTTKVKYTYPYGQSQLGNVREETTNYVKKGGMLMTISEPAPYHYNKFAEEPQTNTEAIEIKEYRKVAASAELAELKQLQPVGPMQFFKYARNL